MHCVEVKHSILVFWCWFTSSINPHDSSHRTVWKHTTRSVTPAQNRNRPTEKRVRLTYPWSWTLVDQMLATSWRAELSVLVDWTPYWDKPGEEHKTLGLIVLLLYIAHSPARSHKIWIFCVQIILTDVSESLTWKEAAICRSHSFLRLLQSRSELETQLRLPQSSLGGKRKWSWRCGPTQKAPTFHLTAPSLKL